ncbi:MAG: hypothetical protein IJZ42_05425 [Lachnospiraceae bacterium]|nr:hypothetical protein [Lachnospiraceae bacterium]
MGKSVAEREINIWDMFWAICLKWRSILISAVIFMILFGGYSYYESLQNVNTVERNQTVSGVGKELNLEERNAVEACFEYVDLYNEQKLYNENAVIMNLDANNFYLGELSYYVNNYYEVEYPTIDKSNNVAAIIKGYKTLLNSEVFAEKVNAVCGAENYAMELIDSENLYGEETSNITDADRGYFTISVYARSKDECDALKELVKEEITAGTAGVSTAIGKHEIKMFQDMTREASSYKLLEYQKNATDKLQSSSVQMTNFASKFTDQQKNYFKLLQEDVSGTNKMKSEEQTKATSPSISKKKLVFGFVIGAFLAFIMWALLYMTNNRLRLEEDFEKVYEKKLLGNIPVENSRKKKLFGFIDRIFIGLRHLNQRYFEQEKAYEMVAANIRISLKKAENKTLLVSGAICGHDEKKVVEELVKRLKHDGIRLEYTSPFLYNAEALEKLVEIGQVIFIEKAEKSLCQEVYREIEICEQQNINLIGCIVIY